MRLFRRFSRTFRENPSLAKMLVVFTVRLDQEFVLLVLGWSILSSARSGGSLMAYSEAKSENEMNIVNPTETDSKKKRVVVLGTGWAGTSFLKNLKNSSYDVQKNVAVHYWEAECFKIDAENKKVYCRSNLTSNPNEKEEIVVDYDYLVIAMGARPNTFNIPGVAENCHFLKEIEDAQKIRRTIIDCFERASLPNLSEEEREKILHFVVVGGGPTGVEFAAELHDYVNEDLVKLYPKVKDAVKITLLEATDHILNMFDKRITAFAEEKFQRDGIDVKTGAMVVKVSDKEISTKELKNGGSVSTMPYGMVVWSTGIGTRPVIMDFMKQIGQEDVWAIFRKADKDNSGTLTMHTLADLLKASKGDAVKESVEVNLERVQVSSFPGGFSNEESSSNSPGFMLQHSKDPILLTVSTAWKSARRIQRVLCGSGVKDATGSAPSGKHFGQFAPLGGEQNSSPASWRLGFHWPQHTMALVFCICKQASQLAYKSTGDIRLGQAFCFWKRLELHLRAQMVVLRSTLLLLMLFMLMVFKTYTHSPKEQWVLCQHWLLMCPIMAAEEEENGVVNNGGKHKDPDKAATEIVVLDSDASETDIINGAESGSASASARAGRSSCVSRAVPPFLLKIYDMLGNDETNSLISWSSTGTSFVVMDPQLFAVNVLPIYFKHRNFQSFITQLNSYGFKKISWEKWEYKNEYFRKGEKHLLRNIKRIYQSNSHRTRSAAPGVDSSSCSRNIEEELELLKKENDILNSEIKKLKEKQEILEEKVASLTYQAVNNEGKMVLDEGGTGQHQPSAFISLVDLIGESSDWVEHIKEMQEKANNLKS
ncbi:External alternative NAD(P)H-ubiquinone oxidoreductase B2, mitochondrial [Sesamum angolense]|uniref:NADH:ubiquinone reductase (non-electrogenic) n=1 Tax=Sesamum angolense TaxID=2727404 RepID=A0AAE2BVN1_9LAMI|nr:External alternative NAD(P)H-ubiquinone oxidoreductase B2, mitochondrial [Sesamum angolense]